MIFSVIILGSSAALPTSQRYPTAQALQVDEQVFLIDCAEGAQMQLRRYKIKLRQIRAVFISHLHGDHVFGLPGLLSSLSLLDRTEPLDVFGPPYLEEWIAGYMKYFTPPVFPLQFHTLTADEPEIIYEDKRMTVACFPLKHRIPTWGYLFREKGKPLNIRKDMIDFYHIPIRDIRAIKAGADYRTEEGKLISNKQLTHPPVPPVLMPFVQIRFILTNCRRWSKALICCITKQLMETTENHGREKRSIQRLRMPPVLLLPPKPGN